jgi:hypothetical protein
LRALRKCDCHIYLFGHIFIDFMSTRSTTDGARQTYIDSDHSAGTDLVSDGDSDNVPVEDTPSILAATSMLRKALNTYVSLFCFSFCYSLLLVHVYSAASISILILFFHSLVVARTLFQLNRILQYQMLPGIFVARFLVRNLFRRCVRKDKPGTKILLRGLYLLT